MIKHFCLLFFTSIIFLGHNSLSAQPYSDVNDSFLPDLILDDKEEDHAGVWKVFEPGHGNINYDPVDWSWVLTLNFPEPKTIASMQMVHNQAGEGWSTSSETLFNKTFYPLVVFYRGERLNTDYDQLLGTYYQGQHTFELFGQKESTHFAGGMLLINFTDGTSVRVKTEAQYFTKQDYPQCDGADVPFNPGRIWLVQEGIWTGKWIRRENSDFFDATWHIPGSYGSQETRDELTLESVDGQKIKIYRKGTNGYYHGILSCDKTKVIDGVGDWFVGGDRWVAKILETDEEIQSSNNENFNNNY